MEEPQQKREELKFVKPEEVGVWKYVLPKKGGDLEEIFSEIPRDELPAFWEIVGVAIDPVTDTARTGEIIGSEGRVSSIVEIKPRFYKLPERLMDSSKLSEARKIWEERKQHMEKTGWKVHMDDLVKVGDDAVEKNKRLQFIIKNQKNTECKLKLGDDKNFSRYWIKDIVSADDQILYLIQPLFKVEDEPGYGDEFASGDNGEVVLTEEQFNGAREYLPVFADEQNEPLSTDGIAKEE